MSATEWHSGGCHCGRVRFRARFRSWDALDCNCSICKKKGFLHAIVPRDDFELSSGAELLSSYEFNTKTAKHRFCSICGAHAFYTPRSHPDRVDVNVRCLDGELAGRFVVQAFDGENWEDNVEAIR